MSALQATYGLWPLRQLRREIAAIRAGRSSRVGVRLPTEVAPIVEELNDLLAHNERQAEEARRHAGNLAHALKTPLTVIMNEATARSDDLTATVVREATTMRRQVDHHLARARAVGRRGSAQSLAEVWPSLQAVERAVSRLYPDVTIDLDGIKDGAVRVERQDLDEMLGNLIENAAKYGGGRVFVTVTRADPFRQARNRPRPRHRPRRGRNLWRRDQPRGKRGSGRTAGAAAITGGRIVHRGGVPNSP
jgi:signal transduction histidine kinase